MHAGLGALDHHGLAIFRFVQECLTNTHRHSGSKGARITVGRKGENIYVEVQDHGKGMSRERLAEVQSHGMGVGLTGMRERVRQLHGEFSIESNSLGPALQRCDDSLISRIGFTNCGKNP
jgi:two-component system sensor histidine kinase UhpB